MRRILISGLMMLSALCCNVASASEEPQNVTLCDVLGDPAAFNHKLVKISGIVSRGFEDFTLNDDLCHNNNTMWLELGGTRGSQVIYCCGDNNVDRRRKVPLVVEGIETTLIEDQCSLGLSDLPIGDAAMVKPKSFSWVATSRGHSRNSRAVRFG